MPIENVWEPTGLHMHYRGETNGDEILEHVLALASDPRIDDVKYIIGDFSESTGIHADEIHVKKLAAFNSALARTNPKILNPTVLPQNDSSQALVALYVLITEDMPWQTTWVRSIEQAREWIASKIAEK